MRRRSGQGRVRISLGAWSGVLLALVVSRPAGAQDGGDGSWTFANLIGGFCVEFLADSADARHLLPDDAFPLRAGSPGVTLHPAIARVVKDQPEYASWTPAQICVYRFGAATVAGTEIVARPGEGESIGWVALTARMAADQPEGSWVATQLFTGGSKAQIASRAGQLELRRVRMQFGQAPKSTDERYVLQFGGTRVIWDGHPAGDSSAVSAPVVAHWARKARGGALLGRWELSSQQSRSMVGAVFVEGKDRFAKALRKSPIRYIGPLQTGGRARLSFQ